MISGIDTNVSQYIPQTGMFGALKMKIIEMKGMNCHEMNYLNSKGCEDNSSQEEFFHCNYSFCERIGLPRRFIMVVMSGLVEISMVDIWWLKAYIFNMEITQNEVTFQMH